MSIADTDIVVRQDTSTSNYQVGIKVAFTNNTAASEYCQVEIIPCIRRKKNDEKRYRHNWRVCFTIEKQLKEDRWNVLLPDDYAASKTVASGYLSMKAGTWYQWGNSYKVSIKNDGNTHYVGVYLNCFDTIPRHCPPLKDGEAVYLEYSFKPEKYTIIPSDPSGIKIEFDEKTRTVTYKWDNTARTKYVKLHTSWYNTAGDRVKHDFFYLNGSFELKDDDMRAGNICEKNIPSDIARVRCQVANISSTNTIRQSIEYFKDLPTDCKVWVNVPDVGWKKAIPWVKLPDGTWKKASKVYVRTDNGWKQTIM